MGLRVVIPVAGIGTRLRPHTHTLPKVLVHVAGMPMLGHILKELENYEVEEVTLIIGYMGDKVREYVSEAFPFKFRFIVQEEIKGLGHAIWLSSPGYRSSNDPLLVILGDTLFEADFASILRSNENWIGVKEVADARRFGVVMLDDAGRIKAMIEKPDVPPTNLAVVGIYYFNHPALLYQCLDEVVQSGATTKGEIQLTDALDMMIKKGAVMKPFKIDEWHDCGKAETLLQTNRVLLESYARRNKLPSPPAFNDCVIHQPCAIERGVKLHNCIIGPHVTLGEGAKIKNSIIRDSIVSKNAEVSDAVLTKSIIADNAKVQGHVYRLNVGDASEIDFD
ncbi:NTP transferase domain-containing protein [Candidatus Sumerlaeota bacterium]|nr:NTP transferase domain-containing protein [Candidatus Sumerlaeota bacterium]